MAEYIEREALVRQIICNMAEFIGAPDDVQKHDEQCNYAIYMIEDAHAADVAPVIHAHWTQTSKGVIYCSNCGAVCGIGAHIEEVTEDHYFCYYCGAKMDEEDIHE